MHGSKDSFLDIETKPAVVATFGIRDQHIGHKQILVDGGVICVGMKWLADKKATVYSDWEHGHKEMLQIVHAALEEAEAVATYNGASFDLPKLQGEFLLHGLPPARTSPRSIFTGRCGSWGISATSSTTSPRYWASAARSSTKA